MNKSRLTTLKKFLMNNVEPEYFNMVSWANEVKNGRPAWAHQHVH